MLPRLDDLALFAIIAEAGSFSAAARLCGRRKSGLSKRMAALEDAMGARLLHRTPRNVVLTDLGRDVLVHAQDLRREGEAAMDVIARRASTPAGPVTISASVPGAQWHLAPLLPEIARRLPEVELRVQVTDRFVDLVHENIDIALRSHSGPLPDSDLIGRELRRAPVVLVASPAYVGEHGLPEEVTDLARHLAVIPAPEAQWSLRSTEGDAQVVQPRVRMVADEAQVMLAACSAGLGISALPEWMSAGAIGEGRLVRILPAWTAGEVRTTLLTTTRRGLLPAVRAVVDALLSVKT
ncbi:LysR family transcriptional regulator [Sphingopyxis sp. JAI128]|uniref:LysR family transcriptional regulator n=1 Tax=Sphingopyxis sp. JAI128 TaxID=2723066 RepID=UPI00160FD5F0|nr:LysR family transcriptional regulator [Sphingopyxis sp. JAI128]MBB6426931.1 DNA-binding transcriptional LysR family regulator [Sphingopyxis sp. JAI128]